MMALYDFTLKFALGQQGADPESYVDRLYEAGCDDALIGIGKRGRIAVLGKANGMVQRVEDAGGRPASSGAGAR